MINSKRLAIAQKLTASTYQNKIPMNTKPNARGYFKGQRVWLRGHPGNIIRQCGPWAVLVSTLRERMEMAGTFPDKPTGRTYQYLSRESWAIKEITTTEPQPTNNNP